MNQELQELLTLSMTQYSSTTILLNLLMTLLAALIIGGVYKFTYSGVLYSRQFNLTVLLITMVTAMVIMIIGGNLTLSLGMVGALSIIRFRSAIKDPRDIGFLFWGIAVGLAMGTGAYLIGALGTLIIGLIMLAFNIKKLDDHAYVLVVKGSGLDPVTTNQAVKASVKKYRLKMQNLNGDMSELIFEVKIKKDVAQVVKSLKEKTGADHVHLVTYNGEMNG